MPAEARPRGGSVTEGTGILLPVVARRASILRERRRVTPGHRSSPSRRDSILAQGSPAHAAFRATQPLIRRKQPCHLPYRSYQQIGCHENVPLRFKNRDHRKYFVALCFLTADAQKRRRYLAKGAENGKRNAQRHPSRRGTCDADNVSANAALNAGRDKRKRRAIGFLSRRAAFGAQIRRDRPLGTPSHR